MREYAVTYMTKDGQRQTTTMPGRNHRQVERQIAKMGGTILELDRAEDEYPRSSRSVQRKVGCFVATVLFVVLLLALYWLRTH